MNENLKTLQSFYAGALVDAAFNYEQNGIFEQVIASKKTQQSLVASSQLKQMGIDSIEDLYQRFSALFGCAKWDLTVKDSDVLAETKGCLLCAIAKKRGAPKPCFPFCINPFEALTEELGYKLEVQETLWDGNRCLFKNKKR